MFFSGLVSGCFFGTFYPIQTRLPRDYFHAYIPLNFCAMKYLAKIEKALCISVIFLLSHNTLIVFHGSFPKRKKTIKCKKTIFQKTCSEHFSEKNCIINNPGQKAVFLSQAIPYTCSTNSILWKILNMIRVLRIPERTRRLTK